MIGAREAGVVSVGFLLVVAGTTAISVPWRSSETHPSALAKEARFRETLIETGTLNAARVMLYGSSITGTQAKIVYLVPEGTTVAAGDVLVKFDPTPFEQTAAKENAVMQQADAERRRATEELRLERLRSRGDVDGARQQIRSAESALTNQLEGRGKVAVAEAVATAADAQREVERAATAVADIRPMLNQGFVTRAEVEQAERTLARARDQQRLAEVRLEVLTKFEQPAAVGKSQADLGAARDELSRTTEASNARIAEREAAVASARSRVEESRVRLALARAQIDRTVVRAEGPGLAVYRDLFFGADRRKPQVGDEVWPNQPLITIPDSGQLVVDTRVREIDLQKLGASQPVAVKVDAYSNLILRGVVSLVGALAQDDASKAGTKYFPVTVKVLTTDPRLRTGMTARVEIEVAAEPDAVVVPVEAVFGSASDPYCVVADRGRFVRRAVRVTGDDGVMTSIGAGVAAGERVLLIDPTDASRTASERR